MTMSESMMMKPVTYNRYLEPASYIEEKGVEFAAHFFEQRLKNGAPHAGHYATRTKLFEFLVDYLSRTISHLNPKICLIV